MGKLRQIVNNELFIITLIQLTVLRLPVSVTTVQIKKAYSWYQLNMMDVSHHVVTLLTLQLTMKAIDKWHYFDNK